MNQLLASAETYAALPYETLVTPDATTDGGSCYVARNPELPGCISHGATDSEAVANLAEARLAYVQTLLEDGLTPPLPNAIRSPARVATKLLWRSEPQRTPLGVLAVPQMKATIVHALVPVGG